VECPRDRQVGVLGLHTPSDSNACVEADVIVGHPLPYGRAALSAGFVCRIECGLVLPLMVQFQMGNLSASRALYGGDGVPIHVLRWASAL
jgi:hypothetical protein